MRIQKNAFKNKKPGRFYLIPAGYHRKIIEIIKNNKNLACPMLLVADITKGITMIYNNKCLLDRHGIYH